MLSQMGNFADLAKIQDARAKAGQLARTMIETGKSPNVLAREANATEVTLGQAIRAYREHMTWRTVKPAKAETLRVTDRLMNRQEASGWTGREVCEISANRRGCCSGVRQGCYETESRKRNFRAF